MQSFLKKWVGVVIDYYRYAGPLIRCLDAERAHNLAIRLLKTGLVPSQPKENDSCLQINVLGKVFPNPVGLAAGFDKDAEVSDAMLGQGFGFVEVGTLTPRPQPGNPKPRLFRLVEDKAVINRMGFNNQGHEPARKRLSERRRVGIVGVNLGKNKDSADSAADYEAGVTALGPYADYLVINISSPNTPGLRALQGKEPLMDLLRRTQQARRALNNPPPLLLKIAPDLTKEDLADIAEAAMEEKLDGLIVTNTTIARPKDLRSICREETGGLSGRPLFEPSNAVLGEMYRLTEGRILLIGSGGVASGRDAYMKIRQGASLVQVYTALIYQGTGLVTRIKRELAQLLRQDGFSSLSEAVGVNHRK